MAPARSIDLVLQARTQPQAEATDLRLRVVARPDNKLVAELLAHLDLQPPKVPKIVYNVVPQTARSNP